MAFLMQWNNCIGQGGTIAIAMQSLMARSINQSIATMLFTTLVNIRAFAQIVAIKYGKSIAPMAKG
jgi:hypothetical protein